MEFRSDGVLDQVLGGVSDIAAPFAMCARQRLGIPAHARDAQQMRDLGQHPQTPHP